MKTLVLFAVLGCVLARGSALPLVEDYIESSYRESESDAFPHNKGFMEISLESLKKMESGLATGTLESEQEDEGPQPYHQFEDEEEGEEESGEEESGDDDDDEVGKAMGDYNIAHSDSPRHLRQNRHRFLSLISPSESERKLIGVRNPKRGVITRGSLGPQSHYQTEDEEEREDESGDDDDDEVENAMKDYDEDEDGSSDDDSPLHPRQNRNRFLSRVPQNEPEHKRVGVRNNLKRGVVTRGRLRQRLRGQGGQVDERMHGW